MENTVRKSLDKIKRDGLRIDKQTLLASTERDIRRHAIEDGDDPDQPLTGFIVKSNVAVLRKRLRMTQKEFAAALRLPTATLRNWEQGRVMPDPAARALLKIVSANPQAAFAALAA